MDHQEPAQGAATKSYRLNARTQPPHIPLRRRPINQSVKEHWHAPHGRMMYPLAICGRAGQGRRGKDERGTLEGVLLKASVPPPPAPGMRRKDEKKKVRS